MPTDADVIRALADLGMDEQSIKALPLLPLIQVAWADGEIQAGERTTIETLAVNRFELTDEGQRLMGNWLRYPPSQTYFDKGREALLMVAMREQDGMDESVLSDVVELSKKVARSAGGLFGIGAISSSEAAAIKEIAAALKIDAGTSLDAVKPKLDAEFGNTNRVTITFSTSALDIGPLGGVIELAGEEERLPVNRDGLRVGSDETADIRVEFDESVAGMHAKIFEMNRKFYVQDLESEGGTWVNGERVVERRLLGGESIRFGQEVGVTFKLLRRIPKQMV